MATTAKREEDEGGAAQAPRRVEVGRSELPLHCPTDRMSLWDAHPRVYLPIEESGGRVRCPYCGVEYVLKG